MTELLGLADAPRAAVATGLLIVVIMSAGTVWFASAVSSRLARADRDSADLLEGVRELDAQLREENRMETFVAQRVPGGVDFVPAAEFAAEKTGEGAARGGEGVVRGGEPATPRGAEQVSPSWKARDADG